MCTVTWIRRPGGYQLLCNRDERISRQPALAPRCQEQKGVRYVAPVDGDHGGSWIGANEFALSLCLLNRYGDLELEPTRKYISRGLLLVDLLNCSEVDEVITQIGAVNLSDYRPFNLLVLPRSKQSALLEWNGAKFSFIQEVDSLAPLTSSSLSEPGIAIERRRQFAELTASHGLDEDSLDSYHRSHLPRRGAQSVCMHRDEAATVSLSKISVANGEILFEYESGSPCERNDASTILMPIKKS